MGITYMDAKKLFRMDTRRTTYLIGLSPEGYVGHVYYGRRLKSEGNSYLLRMDERPFTPSVLEREKASFLDFFPTEYPAGGVGDYRESCLDVRCESGSIGCELQFEDYRILRGKPGLPGLPASFGQEGEVETLELVCRDALLNLKVTLSYSVFADTDIITRSVQVENCGEQHLKLEKVYSACLDMDNRDLEMLTLVGSWARERHIQRGGLRFGKQTVSSVKGESSHQEHPFLALVTPEATQETGEVYAMNFVYSGNFMAQAELTQFGQVRMTMGIHSDQFCWNLRPGESFQAPEAVLTYSAEGLGLMTRNFHDFYRGHLIRSPHQYAKRPVLINNWEATYFDFDSEKLLEIAREAKKAGIEMLVMDDGWFGKRNLDDSSLGDWTVNEEKFTSGLLDLVEKVNEIGLQFGIWFEPEMISPDSDLYRAHPDWAIRIAGRTPSQSRAQYVLDLSRKEVVDYAYGCVADILHSAPIAYVKWDMNRQLCDIGSACLGRESQGELMHRYMLGVYEMQARLVTEFPELLLENCSGGGARFDPGMLYYSPQIWCSDNVDAMERLRIQEGTALIYPLSTMGAHVGDCPNHIVGRNTPFDTRAHVAMAGTFGYELDITKIAEEERAKIPAQVEEYHRYQPLMQRGDYYRLASWSDRKPYDCWEVAAKDGSEALVTFVQVLAEPNMHSRAVFLRGLQEDAEYALEGTENVYGGDELMYCGYLVPSKQGDFVSRLYHFVRVR